ncbi:monocarboxylate transporter 13 [Lingula anatina]|uniref:Monocarboxylate transporter 13 n=1 Tax=Lingula anatina TaxID=7574 RepID=A0A1S3HVP8_LINAN|nr:monocarboxylate transporter 13 [Lingula anatina]|eukprot:XP_013389621.1 monocarboxylate transporter 13 [Lingula anatina]
MAQHRQTLSTADISQSSLSFINMRIQTVGNGANPAQSLPNLVLAQSIQSLPLSLLPADDKLESDTSLKSQQLCDHVDKGWAWVTMVAGSASLFIINGFTYSVGVFYLPMLEAFNEGETITSMVGSIFMGLAMIAGVFASILCDKLDCRRGCIIGGFVAAIGLGASFFATNCTYLILTFGIIAGSGLTFCYTSVHISVSHYFNRRRPFAIAVMQTGGSLGQVIWGPVFHLFIDLYTWRGACLLMSAISLHLVVVGALLRPHAQEFQHKKHKSDALFDFKIFKNIAFDLFILNVIFMCITLGMIFVHYPAYAVYSGTSEHTAATLLSAIGFTSMSLKLLLGGALSHPDVDIWTLFTMCQTIVGITTLFCPLFMGSYSGQMAYAVLFGTYSTPFFIGATALTVQYVDVSQLGFAMGILSFAYGIGLFTGPVVAGFMYSLLNSYKVAVQLAGCCLLVNTGIMFLVTILHRTTNITHSAPGDDAVPVDIEVCDIKYDINDLSTGKCDGNSHPTDKDSGCKISVDPRTYKEQRISKDASILHSDKEDI